MMVGLWKRVGEVARAINWDLQVMIALTVVGSLVFCGWPVYVKFESPLRVLFFLVSGWVMIWSIFNLHSTLLKKFHEGVCISRRILRVSVNLLAYVILIAAIAIAITSYDDTLFNFNQTTKGWTEAFMYYSAVVVFYGVVRHLRTLIQKAKAEATAAAATVQPVECPEEKPHYVEAEDHYVKLVFTDRVQHLRARFRDVIASLGDTGIQVQKSFWVHRDSVAAARRVGRRLHLVLKDGVEIPVKWPPWFWGHGGPVILENCPCWSASRGVNRQPGSFPHARSASGKLPCGLCRYRLPILACMYPWPPRTRQDVKRKKRRNLANTRVFLAVGDALCRQLAAN